MVADPESNCVDHSVRIQPTQTALQGRVKSTDLGAQNGAPSSHRLAEASNVTVAPDELMRRVIKIKVIGVLSML